MTTPAQSVETALNADAAVPSPDVRSGTPPARGEVRAWIAGNAHWFLILIPFLLAFWQPLLWCWGWWGNPRTPMFLQGIVPFLAVALAWARRDEIGAAVRRTRENRPRNFWARGNLIPLLIGCLGLFFSHFVYIKGVAIFSLWLIALGVVYRAYGLPVVKAAWVPFAFGLLTIPPPDGVLIGVTNRVLPGLSAISAALFRLITPANLDPKGFVRFPEWNLSVEFREPMSPFAVLVPALTLAMAYVLYRRMNWRQGMPVLIATAVATVVASLLQAVVLVLLYRKGQAWGDWFQHFIPIMPENFLSGEGFVKVLGSIIPAWANLIFSVGVALLVTQTKADASRLARPTGAVANRLGRGVGLIFSPLVALLDGIGKLGKVFQKIERGTESALSKTFRKKRKGGW